MRLTETDLNMVCNRLSIKTEHKYTIINKKDNSWYWTLDIKNKENWKIEPIATYLTTREAVDFLRAFYRGMDFYLSNQ